MRRRVEGGFTLIELLIVVIILGVLAAVVVFAVRGADDKGERASAASDLRAIRTAQEAFCAKAGHYGTMEQLAGDADADTIGNRYKFLSEPSEIHDVVFKPAPDGGPCVGTGFEILCKAGGQPPCAIGGGTGPDDPDPDPEPPGPGSFAPTTPPPFGDEQVAGLVVLSDGKVFAHNADSNQPPPGRSAIYDPTTGLWLPAVPSPFPLSHPAPGGHGVLLVDDPGTSRNDCAPLCDQVLVHFYTKWQRFNPAGVGSWEAVGGSAQSFSEGGFTIEGAVLLLDNLTTPTLVECGNHCGKVLITGKRDGATNPYADLYNPVTDSFERVDYLNIPGTLTALQFNSMARLKDGRVFMVGSYRNYTLNTNVPFAKIFDPVDNLVTDVALPPDATFSLPLKFKMNGTATALPNGDVLLGPEDVFSPAPRGSGESAGSWTKTVGLCEVDTGQHCEFLASLPDGTVMARVVNSATSVSTGQTRRFQPETRKWFRAADITDFESVGGVGGRQASVFLGQNCGSNCNKVLLARKTAQLFTP